MQSAWPTIVALDSTIVTTPLAAGSSRRPGEEKPFRCSSRASCFRQQVHQLATYVLCVDRRNCLSQPIPVHPVDTHHLRRQPPTFRMVYPDTISLRTVLPIR